MVDVFFPFFPLCLIPLINSVSVPLCDYRGSGEKGGGGELWIHEKKLTARIRKELFKRFKVGDRQKEGDRVKETAVTSWLF